MKRWMRNLIKKDIKERKATKNKRSLRRGVIDMLIRVPEDERWLAEKLGILIPQEHEVTMQFKTLYIDYGALAHIMRDYGITDMNDVMDVHIALKKKER